MMSCAFPYFLSFEPTKHWNVLPSLGDKYFQRYHARLVETYREFRLLEKGVESGITFAHSRLTQAKMNSGFSFGESGLLKLSYCDLRSTVSLALAHQWLPGIIQTNMRGGFFKLLGPVVDVHSFRRCDERKKVRRSCRSRRINYWCLCSLCEHSHLDGAIFVVLRSMSYNWSCCFWFNIIPIPFPCSCVRDHPRWSVL